MGQQGAVWTRTAKDREKMEDSGGGLLPAVEGHRIKQIRIEIITGRKLSQQTSLAGVPSAQHRPHCHCCDWKETVTVNQSGCGSFSTTQTTLSLL